MTISVWRYSHLALAVSSFLLLTLLSVTGIILAFEPVSQKTQSYKADNFSQITLAQTLPALRKAYPDISELTVDANQFVKIKASDADGKNLDAYVDPLTGKVLGLPQKKNEFFETVKSLHRSLFLHEVGRAIIGITAFLLMLITTSGIALIIQRQRGVKHFFKRIVRDSFAQYYHVVLGRLSLIPILIIALTGTYLSLARFNFFDTKKESTKVDFDKIKSTPERKPTEIEIFRNTKLSEVESIEFPFSEDVEDYYTIKLNDREIAVNQITGDILSEVKYPKAVVYSNLSLDLHTGRTNMVWALVLAVAAANILFFIYSGFAMTLKRRVNRVGNQFKADESSYIILVGSENGSTYRFAKAVHQQLLKQGQKSFITELNNYKVFPKAQHLIVITATYGIGDAPTNATKFASLLKKHPQAQQVHYSVLGFGSHAYPDFCQFAFEANNLLSQQTWAKPLVDIHTVNDRSPQEFELWAEAWSQQSGITIETLPELRTAEKHKLSTFLVSSNTASGAAEGTFSVRLKSKRKQKVTSGDLLAIYPANDHRERLYSIGVVNSEIQLSIRLHENGLGSGFLHRLQAGEYVRARIVQNEHFHFPAKSPEVVMISNGTGIAPFLGMINQNQRNVPCHLYCGFRESASIKGYKNVLDEGKAAGKLVHLKIALSREGEKQYVSDLIARDADFMAKVLSTKGTIMICGSLAMQKDVMDVLDSICEAKTGKGISFYQSRNQILTDCY
ncbi:PepSY domain-containing protein [Mucilaginibacter terrae]|uniref:Sulfite reductase (NADPH) flavoprotein alpha-component n=1 Tax=Mucilaginibacter terrae TaxID=1955052 RepID=A0ABU3GQ66_9SPHI|nr:PepSY domain-containing protein [Mucilaginibacter terrae]MDT3401929.1 sulfite reductase (NADPH) flavoprotein alpha-component [Mucilaginibacter terrae]